MNAAHYRALVIEKANLVKQHLREFDQEAGTDDALFRKLVLAFFKPDQPITVEDTEKQSR